MTHTELVAAGVRWLRGRKRGCTVVLAEPVTMLPIIPDVVGWDGSGTCTLVECKVSRSDFHRDRKKLSHLLPHLLPGERRWYLTPAGLLAASDLPDGWGLAEVRGSVVKVVVDAPFVVREDRRIDVQLLVSMCRRHEIGSEWLADNARFRPMERP